jgi:hypothetical protein
MHYPARMAIKLNKFIETGFNTYRTNVLLYCSPIEIENARTTFFAGAHYLFHGIGAAVQPGVDEDNMELMDSIFKELEDWVARVKKEADAEN